VEAQPRQVEYYLTKDGRCPFREWFDSLRDNAARAQVDKRIGRLRLGSLGDWDDVGNGVIELRFKGVGPGYRIYCGQDGPALVILLCGGVKRGQQNDINRAREYWRDYKAD
jgi:putative addiction module killer protein